MSGIFDSLFFPVGDGGGGGSATVNGTLRSYQVNEGAEVEAGDFVEFVHKHGAGEIEADTTSSIYNVGVAKSAGTAGQTIQVYCAT